MNRYLEQFNKLRPSERRFVVIVGLVAFLLLNIFFIWPYFKDLDIARARMDKAQSDLQKYKSELVRSNDYAKRINELQREGSDVPAEDQLVHFDYAYHERAAANKVIILSSQPPHTHTNQFFLEQEVGISVLSGERELVDFLYSLGSGDSMMRVRSVSLRPDPNHQQLNANLTIVASYQKAPPKAVAPSKTAPVKAAAPATPPPAAKPATAPPAPAATKTAVTNKSAAAGKIPAVTNKSLLPIFKRP